MIGITGGIASGKSVVGSRLKELGAVVLDADVLAYQVVEPLTAGWLEVKDAFPEVIQEDLTIDRRLLAQIIFADSKRRFDLEAIVHPKVLALMQKEADKWEKQGRLVFCEVPLLYEAGWDVWLKEVWVVYVEPQIQLQRLINRAHVSLKEAKQMIASQMPLEEKVKRAAKVIDNSYSLEHTLKQVDALWKELQHESSTYRS
ncbi:MAG TPA: dephospho-CoA kinase [Firmicutes bacterium]|nr:dephospho-CoA kinase [Bacillota bacterium]